MINWEIIICFIKISLAENINDDIIFVAEELEYKYITNQKNCSKLTSDPFYVSDTFRYLDVCLDRMDQARQDSEFCQCLWRLEKVFSDHVRIHLVLSGLFIASKSSISED